MSTSTTVSDVASSSKSAGISHGEKETIATAPRGGNYKGFVAGVFSGIAKLTVG
jgi:solute carrier family 25 carnitine/acylcarnitine transporter 20/29